MGEFFNDAWPWIWPTVALTAWISVFVYLARQSRRWLAERLSEDVFYRTEARFVNNLLRLILLGLILLGLYVFFLVAPVGTTARQYVATEVRPWVWATLLVLAFLGFGFFGVRRSLIYLNNQAKRSDQRYDDAVVQALTRPLYVTVAVLGANLWASIVPMPEGLTVYIAAASETMVIVLIILFIDGLTQGWMIARADQSKVLRTSGVVLRTALRVALYTVGAVMILSSLGIDATPIMASLGVTSIAIGLALKTTLEDFIAGLLLAADQPVSVGDFVELEQGESGVVLSIGWRTTRLLTREDMHVIVPNSRLAASTLVNRSRPREEGKFVVEVGVAYHSDLDHVAEVTAEVATWLHREDPRAPKKFRPHVTYKEFGDSAVTLCVWLSARTWEEHWGLRDRFIRFLHKRYAEEGITIAFPTRTLDIPPGTVVRTEPVQAKPLTKRTTLTEKTT